MFSSQSGSQADSRSRIRKFIPLALVAVAVLGVVAYHAPLSNGGAHKTVFAVEQIESQGDGSCPDASSLAGTWVKAPTAAAVCTVTQAVATSVGGCDFKIELTVDGQLVTKYATLDSNGVLTEQNGDHHGQLFMNENPPLLKLADGCSFVQQTFGAINDFDGGYFHPSCWDKLARGKENLIAHGAKLWWGKKSEGGMALTQEALDEFRRGLRIDARTWTRGKASNLIISTDNRVGRVDETKCQVTDVYVPLANGDLNERISDEVKKDPKAKCQRELWRNLRHIYRSEIGKSLEKKNDDLLDDMTRYIPLSKNLKLTYVGQDGSMKSTTSREVMRKHLKGLAFRLAHVRVNLKPDHPLKDKVAFLFANNMLVLGDYKPCQVSEIYVPTVEGRVSLNLKTEA